MNSHDCDDLFGDCCPFENWPCSMCLLFGDSIWIDVCSLSAESIRQEYHLQRGQEQKRPEFDLDQFVQHYLVIWLTLLMDDAIGLHCSDPDSFSTKLKCKSHRSYTATPLRVVTVISRGSDQFRVTLEQIQNLIVWETVWHMNRFLFYSLGRGFIDMASPCIPMRNMKLDLRTEAQWLGADTRGHCQCSINIITFMGLTPWNKRLRSRYAIQIHLWRRSVRVIGSDCV
jgi:hypothetical protein